MARKGAEFAGLSVAITTPLVNGEVDYEALKRQVEFHVEAGTTCLCPVGTTGESPTLSHEEHERVIAEVVQAAAPGCHHQGAVASHRVEDDVPGEVKAAALALVATGVAAAAWGRVGPRVAPMPVPAARR